MWRVTSRIHAKVFASHFLDGKENKEERKKGQSGVDGEKQKPEKEKMNSGDLKTGKAFPLRMQAVREWSSPY